MPAWPCVSGPRAVLGLAILSLGKARESTQVTAEAYKGHVRQYLEALSYAETRDSRRDGCLADLAFVSLVPGAQRRPLWVECKATALGLTDKEFIREVKGYLAAWLNRRPDTRFDLWIFARQLRAPKSWENVFGDQLNRDELARWLAKAEASPNVEQTIAAASFHDVVSFFVESTVVHADGLALDENTADKRRTQGLIHESQRRAASQLALIEQHRHPTRAETTLVSNLVPIRMPTQFAILESDCGSLDQMKAEFAAKGWRPPFGYLGRGRILAFFHETVEQDFHAIGARLVDQLALDEVEANHPAELARLMNDAILKFIFRRGAMRSKAALYLRADRDVAEGQGRTIQAGGKTLQVASPKYVLHDEVEAGPALPTFGALRVQEVRSKSKAIAYVFHEGFKAYFVRMWGGYFVRLQLHRAFTEDGARAIEGWRAAALDETYRKPAYNHADAQLRKLGVLADYLFGMDPPWPNRPAWSKTLRFDALLSVDIAWEPKRVNMHMPAMFREVEDA